MKINWKIRIMNKAFWTGLIPAVILLVQAVLNIFGVQLDLGEVGGKLLAIVDAAFMLLAILGVVTDPTTPGAEDSDRAMSYTEPGK